MAHITFIHGIANKPPEDRLIEIWVQALAKNDGLNLDAEGVSYDMVYWADVLYAEPDEEGGETESLESMTESTPGEDAEDLSWADDLADDAEVTFVKNLAERLDYEKEPPGDDDEYTPPMPEGEEEGLSFERIPLPWFVKRRVMKQFLRDVHHYLFNTEFSPRPGTTYRVQDEIRRRFLSKLQLPAGVEGPHIVLSHSMGTVIAYDCLKRVGGCPVVDGLMTVGSPLGIDEIQDVLGKGPDPKWTRDKGFPEEKVRGVWVNVFDRLDPVCGFDPVFANDYRKGGVEVVRDINEQNYGKWRHSIHKYLSQPKLQEALKKTLF